MHATRHNRALVSPRGYALLFAWLSLAVTPGCRESTNGGPRGERTTSAPPPLRLPHRTPAWGLAWSQNQYPEQYAEDNTATQRLHGLDDRGNERFLDVANRAFSREFVAGFSYTDPSLACPVVELEYCRRAETFTGRLRAQGLKPHFAYQVKLRGDPKTDNLAFERIGRLGRWRKLGSRLTNFSDAEVDAAPDRSAYESYIFFDVLITDEHGNATKDLYLDSTLHVLFNQPNQGSPKGVDSRPMPVPFTNTASALYANPKPSVPTQFVYAQTEAGSNGQVRPDIGDAFLPTGTYQARLSLVEETFHGYGDGGFWPTVMECDVAFEVLAQPRPPSPLWRDPIPDCVPVPFTAFQRVAAQGLAQTPHACSLEPDGSGGYPRLVMTNALPLVRGQRQIATFDMKTDGTQELLFFAGTNRQLTDADRYRIPASGHREWQRVELEFTLASDPEACFLAIYGPLKGPAADLRDFRVVSLPSPSSSVWSDDAVQETADAPIPDGPPPVAKPSNQGTSP